MIDLRADLRTALKDRGLDTRRLGSDRDSPSIPQFRRNLQAVLQELSGVNTEVVIFLDEIEYLTPSDRVDVAEGDMTSVAQFLGVLRSLVQENSNFTFIVSGLTSAIIESGRLFGRPNPLFSWAKTYFLSPFQRTEADELSISLGSRMGIKIESGALDAFFEATGGHAFLYRNLASAVVQELPVDVFQRRIEKRDVLLTLQVWKRTVAGNIDEMLNHVTRYYPTESTLLGMLEDGSQDFDVLAEEYPQEMQHLTSLGLIEHDGQQWQLATLLGLR